MSNVVTLASGEKLDISQCRMLSKFSTSGTLVRLYRLEDARFLTITEPYGPEAAFGNVFEIVSRESAEHLFRASQKRFGQLADVLR